MTEEKKRTISRRKPGTMTFQISITTEQYAALVKDADQRPINLWAGRIVSSYCDDLINIVQDGDEEPYVPGSENDPEE